mgnify:CR=1 FL=1
MYHKIATLVPVAHLDLIKNDSYFMALAHVAENDNEYLDFFRDMAHDGRTVILDNSVVELGEPMPIAHQLTMANYIGAEELVLPDYFEDNRRTLYESLKAMTFLRDQRYAGRTMGVPQGTSRRYWELCARKMIEAGVDTIGVSYRYTEMFGGSRLGAVEWLDGFDVGIHLLGCSADPAMEVAPALLRDNVRGVDSSSPSIYAHHGLPYTGKGTRPMRTNDFLTDRYDVSLLASNIATWRHRCQNGYRISPSR